MRFGYFLSVLVFGLLSMGGVTAYGGASMPASATPSGAQSSLMCADAPADFVKPVPAPFNFWAVVVCAPQSQALVPVEGMIWMAHGSSEPVSILALPPGVTPMPRTKDYDPSYGVRFKALYATEAKGKRLQRALSLLDAAQAGGSVAVPKAKVDHVFQLDAVSNIYDLRYNIYFYVSARLPRAGLVCIDGCRQAMFFDVLSAEEAAERGAGRK